LIVSHRHRFIFFAIPKTGTHAVRFALRNHLGATDEEQVQLFVQSALSNPDIARMRHGHIRWNEIKAAVSQEVWGYFKFAYVRNPWERFVSYTAFMHRQDGAFAADPQRTMERVLADPVHRDKIVFRPQHEFICDEGGQVMVDFVGRNETMQASHDAICAHIGIPTQPLQRVNASTHGAWRDYYTDALKARVADVYARDIAIFGYRFEA
jgi:Sulfotransferase family